jgi:hypothetical protein
LLNVVLQMAQDDSIWHISVESVIDQWAMEVTAEEYDLGYMAVPWLCVIFRCESASGSR